MSRRVWIALFGAIVVAVPLRAQIVVIDPANLMQTILIQERTHQQFDQLRREFEVIQRMAQRLGSLDRYRIPPIPSPATIRRGGTTAGRGFRR